MIHGHGHVSQGAGVHRDLLGEGALRESDDAASGCRPAPVGMPPEAREEALASADALLADHPACRRSR